MSTGVQRHELRGHGAYPHGSHSARTLFSLWGVGLWRVRSSQFYHCDVCALLTVACALTALLTVAAARSLRVRPGGYVCSVSLRGDLVASGSADGTIRLWSVADGETPHMLRILDRPTRRGDNTGVAIAPPGTRHPRGLTHTARILPAAAVCTQLSPPPYILMAAPLYVYCVAHSFPHILRLPPLLCDRVQARRVGQRSHP